MLSLFSRPSSKSNIVRSAVVALVAASGFFHLNFGWAAERVSPPKWSPYVGIYRNDVGSPILGLIRSAKSQINIEIYDMNDTDVLNELRAAMQRGVKLSIVQEPAPVGDKCRFFSAPTSQDDADCVSKKAFYRDVSQHGGRYVPFNKPQLCGKSSFACFQHGKLMIVDNSVAMMSTGNFNHGSFCHADQNPPKCNRDYTVVVENSQVVQALNGIFNKDLAGKAYNLTSAIPPALRRVITVSPIASPVLIAFIQSAKKSILVQNQYLHEPQFNRALMDAARRGVKVMVNLSSPCSFGLPSAVEKQRLAALYQEFAQAGIQTRIFTARTLVGGKPGYLHAKAIVVDGTAGWVGSINGSPTSFFQNREFGLFFSDASWVNRLGAQISIDFNDPHGETWQSALECKEEE